METKNKAPRTIIRTLDRKTIYLLKDRITEPDGKGACGLTFYALYSDIRKAFAAGWGYVMVREMSVSCNDFNRQFGDGGRVGKEYFVGCRSFSKKTFDKILKAAGAK